MELKLHKRGDKMFNPKIYDLHATVFDHAEEPTKTYAVVTLREFIIGTYSDPSYGENTIIRKKVCGETYILWEQVSYKHAVYHYKKEAMINGYKVVVERTKVKFGLAFNIWVR
jgi:hypothetical protein